ncbi:MAG: hypothetical protein IJI58_04390 [Bacilli bacterium]|nr:hypothetical protein [Bacilli bacterium]
MAKKKKKELKDYLTIKNIMSILLPEIAFGMCLWAWYYDLIVLGIIIIFAIFFYQMLKNKAEFSHTNITLAIFFGINVILEVFVFIPGLISASDLVSYNIVYSALFFVLNGIAVGINKKKKDLLFLMIFIGLVLFCMVMFFIISFNSYSAKPIIYIYPEKDMDVEIKVSNPERFTVTYPKYEEGWKVKALTDGTLIDSNNKKYYALYWEGKNKSNTIKEDGFIVKGKDSAEFLEEKLEILGLNYKEANEFIMYWLPKLESNKYNYIRFKTREEIDNNMKLNINPEPDTLIRVMMEYKGLDKKIKVKEEKLTKVERKGYTVVEWGGTEIK